MTSTDAFSWAGITFDHAGPYYLQGVEGWSGPPDGSADDVPIAAGHGSLLTRVTRKARVVTVEGVCVSESTRDSLLSALDDALAAGFGDGDGTYPLTGVIGGRTLTADAQLLRYEPKTEQGTWVHGVFGFALQFRCPDPMRYGSWTVFTAGIDAPVTGLVYPVTYPVTYPAQAPSGQVSVFNAGNAKAPALITLVGPLSNNPGVSCVGTGAQIRYGSPLVAGDVLVVDTAQGAMFLNGEFRSPMTSGSLFNELRVPVGASTWQSLGDPTGSGAQVSVAFRPAFW